MTSAGAAVSGAMVRSAAAGAPALNRLAHVPGEPTDLDADPVRGNWAPSIDHLTPVNQGGSHTLSNVRIAHRWCNSVRQDQPVNHARALLSSSSTTQLESPADRARSQPLPV
jgi:hypothetical protein